LHKKLGESITLKAKTKLTIRRIARNSSWEEANAGLWGPRPQLLEANVGLGAKLPASGSKVWGRSTQRSAIFTIFQQNDAFLGIRLKFLL